MLLGLSIISGRITKISGSDIVSRGVRGDCRWREAVRTGAEGRLEWGEGGSDEPPLTDQAKGS